MNHRRLIGRNIACMLLAVFLLGGCETFIAQRIVWTPNYGQSISAKSQPSSWQLQGLGIDRFLRVPVGPPQATLALWIIEPTDGQSPRGTVLVIHGFEGWTVSMLDQAHHLAGQGYRAVLVTHRGYGDYSGELRTFGVIERQDLSQVIDALESHDLLAGKLGVLGMSYGGAMELEIAGHDPRVRAVVILAGFSSIRDITGHYIRVFLPVAGWMINDKGYEAIINRAGSEAGFDPDDASALQAVTRTDAAILFVHGTNDWVVPFAHAERMYAQANADSRLISVPWLGHVGVWMDVDGRVARETDAWLKRWLNETPSMERF
jgi:dipeptidyl aminopeptidase/acylaminoacyl peptidase